MWEEPHFAVPPHRSARELVTIAAQLARAIPHGRRTLAAHLIGTYLIMRSWRVDEFVCQAGLFHAAYDTIDFVSSTAPMLQTRSQLRSLIGLEAEHLVRQFSTLHKSQFLNALAREVVSAEAVAESVHISAGRAHLLHICLANFVEQIGELDPREAKKRFEQFSVLSSVLNSDAREHLYELMRDERS